MCCFEKFEEIVNDFEGVQKIYVIQVGCEICVIVDCELVIDEKVIWLLKDIVKCIENEFIYLGQIKVIVICES